MRMGRYTQAEKNCFKRFISDHAQGDMTEFMQKMNITKDTLNCWKEADPMPIRKDTERIAEYFGVTVDDVLGEGTAPKMPPTPMRKKTGPKPKEKKERPRPMTGEEKLLEAILHPETIEVSFIEDLIDELRTRADNLEWLLKEASKNAD